MRPQQAQRERRGVEKFLEDLIAQGDDPQNLADGGHFLDTVQEAQKLLTRIKREA